MVERYTLEVKSRATGSWLTLDLSEAPVVTLQVNDLAEATDRNASFSQTLSLPKSSANLAALGAVDVFESQCDTAYASLEALLLCDGRYLLPPGSRLYVDKVTRFTIETQIVAGVYDLFTALDAPMDPIGDTGAFIYTAEYMSALSEPVSTPDRLAVAMPALYKVAAIDQPSVGGVSYGLTPAVQFIDLVRKILASHGYGLTLDIEQNGEAVRDYLLATPPPSDPRRVLAVATKRTIPDAEWEVDDNPLAVFYGKPYESGTSVFASFTITAVDPASYGLTITALEPEKQTAHSVWVRTVSAYDQTTSEFVEVGLVGTVNGAVLSLTIDPVKLGVVDSTRPLYGGGDFLEVEVRATPGGNNNLRFEISRVAGLGGAEYDDAGQEIEPDHVTVVGSEVDLYAGLGFDTQADAVRAFVQTYGLTLDTLHYSTPKSSGVAGVPDQIGEVRAYTLEELYRRRDAGLFVDWSDMLDVAGEDNAYTFAVGSYARSNTVAMAENSEGVTDTAAFAVANDSLAATKTIVSLPFESPLKPFENRAVSGRVEIDEGATDAPESPSGENYTLLLDDAPKPALVRLSDERGTGYVYDEPFYAPEYPAVWRRAAWRGADYSLSYYAGLRELLTNARTVTARFALSASDIAGFDFMTPVWVEHYGAHFYVSKITNFVAGTTTAVELIRL